MVRVSMESSNSQLCVYRRTAVVAVCRLIAFLVLVMGLNSVSLAGCGSNALEMLFTKSSEMSSMEHAMNGEIPCPSCRPKPASEIPPFVPFTVDLFKNRELTQFANDCVPVSSTDCVVDSWSDDDWACFGLRLGVLERPPISL